MTNENMDAIVQEQPKKRRTPLGHKIAIACIIVAAATLATSFGSSILRVILNENASLEFLTVTVAMYWVLPVAILVVDFITLRVDKWRAWSFVSLSLKGWYLLTLIPSFIYVISRILIYPASYYSSLISYLLQIVFMLVMIYPSIYNIRKVYQLKKKVGNMGGAETISQKKSSPFDVFSIIGITVGFIGSAQFLIGGIASIDADGYAQIGVIFIPPALMAITVVLLDFLALRGTKWLTWSIISLAAKGCLALTLLGNIVEIIGRILSGKSYYNLSFYILLLILAMLIIYPSVRNIININKKREQQRVTDTPQVSSQYPIKDSDPHIQGQETMEKVQTTNINNDVPTPPEQTKW